MKQPAKLDQRGVMNTLLVPFILVTVFFVAAASVAGWAYMSRQDFKTNSDKKVATAVELAKKQEAERKETEFIEREKNPLKEYLGPEAFGSLVVKYPKTWGAYVVESNGTTVLDGYFNPNFVPGTSQQGVLYALRVEVISNSYSTQLAQYENQVKQGKLRSTPYKAVNVPSVVGSRLDGEIENNKQGSLVILPLRDKTLKISTEANQFVGDFNDIILANLKFTP